MKEYDVDVYEFPEGCACPPRGQRFVRVEDYDELAERFPKMLGERMGKIREWPPMEGRKSDQGKRRMDLIPPEAMEALADVLTMGAAKYDARNWEKGFAWGRSVAALLRHLFAWMRGENKDPESGLSHLAHVLCNAAFLVTFEVRGIGTDDRAKATEGK